MPNCQCFCLLEEVNAKMKAFDRKYRSVRDIPYVPSLKMQYDLIEQQQLLKVELRQIEVRQDVLAMCRNFSTFGKQCEHRRQISEYLIGPMRDKMITDWVGEETGGDCEMATSDEGLIWTIPSCCLDLESDRAEEAESIGKWVLVYGFTPNLLPLIDTMFSQIGESISTDKSPAGDWAAFKYIHARDVERALRHHESLVNGQVIGVTNKADFIQKVRDCPVVEIQALSRPIRALNGPRIEPKSANCRAPAPYTRWQRILYNIKDLLNF